MSEFFQGKAEFRQPHAFRNLEEVYPDGQPLPRIDDSDRIEFFESQRFRTGAKGKKQKKKTPDPRVDAEKDAFAELGGSVSPISLSSYSIGRDWAEQWIQNTKKKSKSKMSGDHTRINFEVC